MAGVSSPRGGSEVGVSGGAWGPRGRVGGHTCHSQGITPSGSGGTPLLISELFTGAVRGNTGLSLNFQRKHLVKTSKPRRMLLALLGLLTELLTDSATVHQG